MFFDSPLSVGIAPLNSVSNSECQRDNQIHRHVKCCTNIKQRFGDVIIGQKDSESRRRESLAH